MVEVIPSPSLQNTKFNTRRLASNSTEKLPSQIETMPDARVFLRGGKVARACQATIVGRRKVNGLTSPKLADFGFAKVTWERPLFSKAEKGKSSLGSFISIKMHCEVLQSAGVYLGKACKIAILRVE